MLSMKRTHTERRGSVPNGPELSTSMCCQELKNGQACKKRPVDGAPVTTSCSSLRAREEKNQSNRGCKTFWRWFYTQPKADDD